MRSVSSAGKKPCLRDSLIASRGTARIFSFMDWDLVKNGDVFSGRERAWKPKDIHILVQGSSPPFLELIRNLFTQRIRAKSAALCAPCPQRARPPQGLNSKRLSQVSG